MKTYQKLLSESMTSADNVNGRPTILAITRKTNKKLYKLLVAEQPTRQPIATVYGVKYSFESGTSSKDILSDRATGTGQYSYGDTSLPILILDQVMIKNYRFRYSDFEFEVLRDGTSISTADVFEVIKALELAVLSGSIRIVNDAIGNDAMSQNKQIQQTNFTMERWTAELKSRKVRSLPTQELLKDMEGMGLDGEAAIEDLIATTLSTDINSDIISKLVTIAGRYKGVGAKKGYFDVTLSDANFNKEMYVVGNALVGVIAQMSAIVAAQSTFKPNWALCSSGAAAILESSNLVEHDYDDDGIKFSYIKSTGMRIVIDSKSFGEYVMVGFTGKADDTLDTISPLYYSPYEQSDGGGTFTALEVLDQESLQPAFGMMSRYALCAAPSTDIGKTGPINGEDWVELSGRSQLCMICPIIIKEVL